jgi:3-oxoacyl-[acyl-carrier protein] reductase
MELQGKTAIVTGASRGIGKAIAHGLAQAGVNVCLVARASPALHEATAEINSLFPNKAIAVEANVELFDKLKNAFSETKRVYGQIDICFANAGINQPSGNLECITIDDIHKTFKVNTFGVINTCKLAIEFMQETGGNLITIGSAIGHNGAEGCSIYAATKAANWIFTRSIAEECKKHRINVNELIPGAVKTAMNPHASGSHWKEPADIVPMALFLASQDLLKGASGQSFSLKHI